MHCNTKFFDSQAEKNIGSRIDHFFHSYCVGSLLNQAGIRKLGFGALFLFKGLFHLIFMGKSMYISLIRNREAGCEKSTIYRFLNTPTFNWRNFLIRLTQRVINQFFTPLTSEDREKVLIIDDSPYERDRSKKVELLSWIFDHNRRIMKRGFRLLTLGWSDGTSFLPVDFALLASAKKEKQLQEVNPAIDKRSCGGHRRREAVRKATDMAVTMVKRALSRGLKADYVLFDSWFSFPSVIDQIAGLGIHVICHLKPMPRITYFYNGEWLTLKQIYRKVRKRRGKARILASVEVRLRSEREVKIVFVRHRQTKGWIALLSTHCNLPDDEVVRIYGKRWDIEVFFKICKSFLALAKEIQMRSYDALIAHTTLVMVRYIFLSVEHRGQNDDRTIGLLFHACCEEIADLNYLEAMKRILSVLADKLRNISCLTEEIIKELIDSIMESLNYLFLPAVRCGCES